MNNRNQFSSMAVILAFALALAGCEEASPDLLPQSVMRNVLVEMHVADAYTETVSKPITYRNTLREDLYLEILAKYDLDEETFRHTYEYYTSHPDLMDSLYQEVILALENQSEGERKKNLEVNGEDVPEQESPPEEAPRRAPWQNPDGSDQ